MGGAEATGACSPARRLGLRLECLSSPFEKLSLGPQHGDLSLELRCLWLAFEFLHVYIRGVLTLARRLLLFGASDPRRLELGG